ncbi:hypothetical protein D0864_01661 [Hortaea werneckii]|uniref:Uncharacterized protein n=1 Tax=Hortaea werneckii TaxID=91943 RepID=A0A3M7H620_HORWE|nr:hypothetical protein KC352_g14186 [Hortaea werneckii]KAI7564516.1 hypothetical protein KC317_g7003 [Hortaea werneckii]KAI7615025.1 hypothetical protein KC346_g6676 [Hortaea werneckii]RMZ08784.1 hypothetical protein D0864_01661 [Hortaea werneckii]
MEEDPKDHDFDQRHDGPFERPSLHMRRQSSKEGESPGGTARNAPEQDEQYHTPMSPDEGRKSFQIKGRRSTQQQRQEQEQPDRPEITHTPSGGTAPRTSMQTTRPIGAPRPSKDFDQRRDGPFGRPSLNMTRPPRRKSSGQPFPTGPDERRPTMEKTHEEHPGPGGESDHSPPSMEMLPSSTDPIFQPEPPPLHYSLYDRKWSIIFFWGLILVDCIAMPLVLYFCLWHLTDLSPNTVFSIVTAALGGISIFEYFIRLRRLWMKTSTCRPIGSRRIYLDWFHWNFTFGWIIIMIELIVGTVPEHPPIRLLAMPCASMLYVFGTELIVCDVLRYFHIPAPLRVSSVPKGSQLRPCVYSMIEDIVAVDGSGGTAYRENLNRRYEASHVFRAMLRRLGIFWALGAMGIAVVLTILIFTIDDEAAYVVGWAVPFVWAGFWTLATWLYVRVKLREEKVAWAEEVAAKNAAI